MCGRRTTRTGPSVATRLPRSAGRPGPPGAVDQASELFARQVRVGVVAADTHRRPVWHAEPIEQSRRLEEELLFESLDEVGKRLERYGLAAEHDGRLRLEDGERLAAVEQANQVKRGPGQLEG